MEATAAKVAELEAQVARLAEEAATEGRRTVVPAGAAETGRSRGAAPTVTTAGPQLHPAQVRAIARAEEAAAEMERLQEETKRRAEQYAA